MEKAEYRVSINAPRERVWDVLWGEHTYPEWTKAFSPMSQVETDWQEGSKILFLDGKGNGMVSRAAKVIPNEYMSIEHLGMYDNGKEDLESDEVKAWQGATENYLLEESNGCTNLTITMDINAAEKDFFTEAWPKALTSVRDISEKN